MLKLTANCSGFPTASFSQRRPTAHKHGCRLLQHSLRPFSAMNSGPVETSVTSVVSELKQKMQTWTWREKKINYLITGEGPPLVMVHGFAASILHFRSNIPVLAESFTIYTIDLLGFGGSEKADVAYSIELWRDLLIDFTTEFVKEPFLIVGNSLGSLTSIMAAAELKERVIGLAMLNCAGAMNNKGLTDDWRIRLAMPLILLVDLLLSIKPVAKYLFNKLATKETIRSALEGVYCNKDVVDSELVEIFSAPSKDDGALEVFVSVITGPGGPRPMDVVQQLSCPILVLWGKEDVMTPFDNPLSNFLKTYDKAQFVPLEGTGHALHDDSPETVNSLLLPWLKETHTSHLMKSDN